MKTTARRPSRSRIQFRLAGVICLATALVTGHLLRSQSFDGSVTRTPGGQWQLTWNSIAGEEYLVQRSTDFRTWTDVQTVIATGTSTTFVDSSSAGPDQVFWRLRHDSGTGPVLITPFSIIELVTVNAAGDPVPRGTPGADWRVSWESEVGADYKLQRSIDVAVWTDIATVTAVATTSRYVDTEAPDARRQFWRVVKLSGGGTGPVTISEPTPRSAGGGALSFEIQSEEPLDSVIFFDGDTPLGEAEPGLGGSWSFPLEVDPQAPRVVRLSVQVNPIEGGSVQTDPVGLLVADTSKFVPLAADGSPGYGDFVAVGENGALSGFAFYPEGVGDPEDTTGAHFVFGPGAMLDETAGGATVSFTAGEFHRGHYDPAPLPAAGGFQQIDLNSIDPATVAARFVAAGEGLQLLWEGNSLDWVAGELVAEGWAALQVRPSLGGLVFPDELGEIAVKQDPATGELYLVVCFHGEWAPATGGTTFRVPPSDPLKVYLYRDGRIDASGTAEAVFPDGATMRGSIAWREPVFELRIEGKGFTIPAFTTLRENLPTAAGSALPVGSVGDDLDAGALRLEGMRDAMRGLAAGSAGQGSSDSTTSYGATSTPADGAGSALRAWAGRLVSWTADREGESLSATAMSELTAMLHGAGKLGEGAYDLSTPLALLVEVLRIDRTVTTAITSEAEGSELLAAIADAEARLFASAQRLAASSETDDPSRLLERARLMEQIDLEIDKSEAGGAAGLAKSRGSPKSEKRNGGPERRARYEAVLQLAREINRKIALERNIVAGDFTGANNGALNALDEEGLLGFMGEMLGIMKILGRSDVTQGDPTGIFPLHEAWDQTNDVFYAKHNASLTAAIAAEDFGALRRALSQRSRFVEFQFHFGQAVLSDTGTIFEGGTDGFSTNTAVLVEAFLAAQLRLPGATLAETCASDLQALARFQEFTQDVGDRFGFPDLWDRAAACNKVLSANSGSGAVCDPVLTALIGAGLPVESAPLMDEGDRPFRLTGSYESASVASSFPVTLQINQAGRLILGRIHYHGGPNSPSRTKRLSGMLASEAGDGVVYSILLRADDGSSFLGGGTQEKALLAAGPGDSGIELELRSAPPEGQLLKRFVKVGDLPAHSSVLKDLLPGKAQELFEAQQRGPLHTSQIEALRGSVAGIVSDVDEYIAQGSTFERLAAAVNLGRELESANREITLTQMPVARQVLCEELSRQDADLNGEAISYWNMLRIIFARHRGDILMAPFQRFMGPAAVADHSGTNYKYTFHMEDANVGILSFGVKLATIEITQERADGVGGSNDFLLAGGLGQAGVGLSLTEIFDKFGGGAGSADAVVYSDVEYSEQSLAGPVALIGATGGGGVGAAELQIGPSVLLMYGDETLPPLAVPLPFIDGGNNTGDLGVNMSFGLGYVGSASELPPAQFSFSARPTERRFSAEAGIAGAVHFDSGSPVIRECGWGELRLLAAEMRAIFESPDGSVSILGFTDAEGDDASNLTLSQGRADAVEAALTLLVGEGLALPPDRFRAVGLGEFPATGRTSPAEASLTEAEAAFLAQKKADLPQLADGQPSQAWRTVSIILNNLVRIDLAGPVVR